MSSDQPWSEAACVAFAEFRIAASPSFDTVVYPMSAEARPAWERFVAEAPWAATPSVFEIDPRARAIERRLRDEAKP